MQNIVKKKIEKEIKNNSLFILHIRQRILKELQTEKVFKKQKFSKAQSKFIKEYVQQIWKEHNVIFTFSTY